VSFDVGSWEINWRLNKRTAKKVLSNFIDLFFKDAKIEVVTQALSGIFINGKLIL